MAEPALQLPPEEDNEIDATDLIRQRDGDNTIDISDQIRSRDAVPGPEELPDEQPGAEQPSVVDRAQDLKDQFDQGKELYSKGKERLAARSAKKAGKEGLKEGVEKQGAASAKRKVATQGAQQVAKAGAKTAATTAAKAGATAATLGAEAAAGPVGWVAGALTILSVIGKPLLNFVKNNWQYAVYAVAAILLLLAVPFGLLGGKNSPQYPSTQAQTDQTTLVASIGGDFVLSGRKVNEKVLAAEKKRYDIVLNNIRRTNPERVTEAGLKVKEILLTIEQGINLSGEAKEKQLGEATGRIKAFDSTLPFGEWIANAAETEAINESKSLKFCTITGASAGKACASFVTTVLQNAGIPNPIQAGVDGIWSRPFYRTIASRQQPAIESYYGQNVSKLQRGDIIFWGDGRGKGGSVLFDHVGFYVGNGQAVDNSSSNEKVMKRPAAKRDNSFRFFNGAKRYGKDL